MNNHRNNAKLCDIFKDKLKLSNVYYNYKLDTTLYLEAVIIEKWSKPYKSFL